MDELISIINKGQLSQKIHVYEVGVHNMLLKEKYSDEDIENIAQRIKDLIIKELKNEKI